MTPVALPLARRQLPARDEAAYDMYEAAEPSEPGLSRTIQVRRNGRLGKGWLDG
jgi:hypothetical protein